MTDNKKKQSVNKMYKNLSQLEIKQSKLYVSLTYLFIDLFSIFYIFFYFFFIVQHYAAYIANYTMQNIIRKGAIGHILMMAKGTRLVPVACTLSINDELIHNIINSLTYNII